MGTKRNGKKKNLEELPGEILELIFSKLPFFNLPTCRLVCRSWNTLVLTCKFDPKTSINSNIFFAQSIPSRSHLHCVDFNRNNSQGIAILASFSFDPCWPSNRPVDIISSCNGLLCCSLRFDNKSIDRYMEVVCILNPMTNEYLKLPSNTLRYYYGFGFSSKTNQYKIVRHSNLSSRRVLIEIFAFGTSTDSRRWTHVAIVPFTLRHHGTYFNGALYWVGAQPHQPSTYVIFRFDLDDQKFVEICFTQQSGRETEACCGSLGVFCGTLYLTFLQDRFHYQVWKMERDSSSWIQVFGVLVEALTHPIHLNYLIEPYYRSNHLQLIKAYEDGTILCLVGFNLILYDSKTVRTRIINKHNKNHFLVYQIDSFSFDSLDKILGGDI